MNEETDGSYSVLLLEYFISKVYDNMYSTVTSNIIWS